MLELLVDVLGLDADALAVEPRPAQRDLRHCPHRTHRPVPRARPRPARTELATTGARLRHHRLLHTNRQCRRAAPERRRDPRPARYLTLGRAPSLDQHARPAPRAAGLDTILDSHLEDAVERGLEPWLGSKALCDLLAVLLNAILYSTSVEARPELLPALPQRPAGERLVLSGESVFYLPDKIEISDGLGGRRRDLCSRW